MKNSYKITGEDAIRLAERDGLTIHCYANPIEDGAIVTIDKALEILKEDPRLIYVDVHPVGWVDAEGRSLSTMEGYNVSDYFDSGRYLGPDDDGIEPRWEGCKPTKLAVEYCQDET